ncbi:MAG: hypothetical protein AB7O43_10140 [Hyphomicrobiaceae bacterium]
MARSSLAEITQASLQHGCGFAFAPCLPEPERLVGLGFRLWYSGYVNADLGTWEQAWRTFGRVLNPEQGRAALEDLSRWVRTILDKSARDIEVLPATCRSFCRDECVAVAMIAAAQHGRRKEMRACALTLLDTSAIDEVMAKADCLAATLTRSGVTLSTGSVVDVSEPVTPATHH